jgi:hypothetical protein
MESYRQSLVNAIGLPVVISDKQLLKQLQIAFSLSLSHLSFLFSLVAHRIDYFYSEVHRSNSSLYWLARRFFLEPDSNLPTISLRGLSEDLFHWHSGLENAEIVVQRVLTGSRGGEGGGNCPCLGLRSSTQRCCSILE